jgi:tRNA-guanine family transglycosylase
MPKELHTSTGDLHFPAFLPVTTFGGKFPLDEILRPHLPRFTEATMVSHHYAQKMKRPVTPITFIDSGGFASLFQSATFEERDGRFCIRTGEESLLDPLDVLAFQTKHAQIGATLDFIIPPDLDEDQAGQRQEWTLRNAVWAIQNLESDLKLFGSIQAWDFDSAARLASQLAPHPFSGFALGGMVPRISKPQVIFDCVAGIRSIDSKRPLHVFGIGSPRLIKSLFEHGVDSVDSSSYVRSAVSGRYLDPQSGNYASISEVEDPKSKCPCRVCQTFDREYLQLEGELNTMALALHNLAATLAYLHLDLCQPGLTSV